MLPATVTITIASPAVITDTAHGMRIGDPIVLETTGVLPSGISIATTYYIISAGFTTDSYRVSLNPSGNAVNTSGSQSGTHTRIHRIKPVIVTITSANPGVVTDRRHEMSNDDTVMLNTDGTLPGTLAALTVYYVKNKTDNAYELAATRGGTSIDTSSGAGSGTHTLFRQGETLALDVDQFHPDGSEIWQKVLHNAPPYRPIRVYNLVTGSRVKAIDPSNGTVLGTAAEVNGMAEIFTRKTGQITIEARKASGAPYYKPWVTTVNMDASVGRVEAFAVQISDA